MVLSWALGCAPGLAASKTDKSERPADSNWSVDAPPGPASSVSIDVVEGTWMSVDVSPDGTRIVFDLLGDLYEIPIQGGEAVALTSGISWDMHPRYSPDGKWVAFTSDRAGGDNLWKLNLETEKTEQITKESFRLFSSPVWTPDGQYVAGRKHLTARRSLGTGEIWLVHHNGGAGVALTHKTSDQKDVGEPAFSPDGRYLYYSRDTTPGDNFEYNKDPHAGIYSIFRLDRQTGDTAKLLGGPGGAVRPTPSPDGALLAFVRRAGDRTALYVLELASGKQFLVDDGLDRDMQETWAIHGVYPSMAFTPDSRSIVYWARGQIQRAPVRLTDAIPPGGAPNPIAFHVKTKRQVRDAVRFPVEVSPDQFDVRLLRSAETLPDGRKIFEALGRIWVSQPSGRPHPLTSQSEHFEFSPATSRDGKHVVYVSWRDDELGSVRIADIPAASAAFTPVKGRVVTTEPGMYLHPVFSPDGQAIAYEKSRGGYLTSPLFGTDPGIYWLRVDAEQPEPKRVSESGRSPQFGASSSRVFFEHDGAKGAIELRSMGIHGESPRTHVTVEHGRELRIAPDERHVAWTENYRLAAAPLPLVGGTLPLQIDSKSIPVRRAANDSGYDLRWSAAGDSIQWLLGDTHYSRDIDELFARPLDSLDSLPAAAPTVLGWKERKSAPTGELAIVGARIITMRGDEVIESGTIVVRGDRIAAVGPADTVNVPEQAHRIDGVGLTIYPGLVDVHAHGAQAESGIIPQHNWKMISTLAFGVTTIHDPSNGTGDIFRAAELQRAGLVWAPRIFSTGTLLYGATAWYTAKVDSLEDAEMHLRRLRAAGGISVKSYNQPRRDQRQQIIEAGRRTQMMVVPEGGSTLMHNLTMIVDGHTGVEHALPVAALYADVIQLFAGTKVGYTPTLQVAYGGLFGENYWYQESPIHEHPILSALVPKWALFPRSRRPATAPESEWNHVRVAEQANRLRQAGVRVNVGAHGQREGLAAHWELWSLCQGGFTPLQALRAGTLHGAEYLGLDGDIGSIEKGKLADFAVVQGNPLADIRQSDDIVHVVQGGVVFDPAPFRRIYPAPVQTWTPPWRQSGVDEHFSGAASAPTGSECHGCGVEVP